MSDKHTIDLSICLYVVVGFGCRTTIDKHDYNSIGSVSTLTKTIETNFIPQHGMIIMMDGLSFQVQTIALAGFSGLKHIAHPTKESNKTLTCKTAVNNIKIRNTWLSDTSARYVKNGWKSAGTNVN